MFAKITFADTAVAGSVSALNGNSFTMISDSNTAYTINTTGATIFTKNSEGAAIADILIGDNVIILGANNGIIVTASSVIDRGITMSLIPVVKITVEGAGASFSPVGTPDFSQAYEVFVDNNIPYVTYMEGNNSIIVKKYNGINWENVGGPDFCKGFNPSFSYLSVYNGTPFVACIDGVMKYDGTNWVYLGNFNFSQQGGARVASLSISDGIPYVAFLDSYNNYSVTVMKYNGINWENVGNPNFSDKEKYISLSVSNGIPYVAYSNGGNINVEKYDGTIWVNVGNPDVSVDQFSHYLSFSVSDGVPYLAYENMANNYKINVIEYNGTGWVNVGNPDFPRQGGATWPIALFVENGTPYAAYISGEYNIRPVVMKYDGTNWVSVGSPYVSGWSLGTDTSILPLFVDNDTPYVTYPDYYTWQGFIVKLNQINGVVSGDTLQMNATVFPSSASNQNIIWTVINGTGSATINQTGLLNAKNPGTVTVTATANDSYGVSGSEQITITNNGTIPIPQLSNLGQFRFDGTTPISVGVSITENIVVFRGTLTNPANNQTQLQVEVQPSGTAFTGVPTATSSFVASGQIASVALLNLSNDQYHWQARAVDSQSNASAWQTMSNPAVATDFSLARNPVIIVPGILGSYLKDYLSGDELWPNFALMALPGSDSYLNALKLDQYGNQDENNPIANSADIFRDVHLEIIGKVLIDRDFFRGLIEELENNGYEENKDLFVFPYDWRMNLDSTTGDSQSIWQATLKQKIIDIKNQTGAEKVDIIAHSMGGLLVKDYIDKNGNDNIDKFIDIATPHLGSPSAFKILNYGDDLDINFSGIFRLNPDEVKSISQNMPSIYQLLPSRKYFESDIPGLPITSSYIYDIAGGNQNVGILSPLNYDQSMSFLNDQGRNNFLLGYVGINAVNVNDELHSRIDNLPNSDNYYNIIGCGQATYAGVEKKGNGNWALPPVDGDGTVPLKSAIPFGSHQYYTNATTHGYIPSANGVRQLVTSILSGNENNFNFSQYSNLGQSQDQQRICKSINGTQVGSHSPVELNIYDENGNHTGPTVDGDIEENIPGVTYDILGNDKYAFLPAGHSYRVVNQATSSGELGITIQKIENSQPIQFAYFDSVKLDSAAANVEYDISDNQTQYLAKVDSNGDGTIDKTIAPDSVLTGEQINDLTAPQTTINISGQAGNNGYYVSDVQIKLSATDDNSGVLKTEYSLDDGQVWQDYVDKIILSGDGEHNIIYRSIDKAGNQEANQTATIEVDQIKPIISVLLPQEGQEVLRNNALDVEYFAADNFSGINTATAKIYFNGQTINSNTIDLFKQNLGSHQVKIAIQDLAGNQAEQIINFSVITDINGTIADVNRAYDEKMITKVEAKNGLINDLTDIKNFQEKYGQRIDKGKVMRDKAMAQCLKYKNQVWCTKKIDTIFDRFEYQLNKINQALIKLKYNLILTKLDVFLRTKWINQSGYNIIRGDMKYLISKL
ncbi:MAG: Ig-like domain-containing protein [Patescibacteria group bacterium]|nr:Ig-like domain-containing protein [Patescibacteria group bacterium]